MVKIVATAAEDLASGWQRRRLPFVLGTHLPEGFWTAQITAHFLREEGLAAEGIVSAGTFANLL